MEGKKVNQQKSYFDVLGICCPSEVPLIERILKSMDGVITVSVIVPSKTVIVVHDSIVVSQLQIGNFNFSYSEFRILLLLRLIVLLLLLLSFGFLQRKL